MVPVDDALTKTIHSAIDYLERAVQSTNRRGDLAGLLSLDFLCNSSRSRNIEWDVFIRPEEWLAEHGSELHEAPQLAILGCLIAEQIRSKAQLPDSVSAAFAEGIVRLRERQNVFITSNSWALQPSIVLGVAHGVSAVGDPLQRTWLRERLMEGFQRPELPLYLHLCYGYGIYVIEHQCLLGDGLSFRSFDTGECTLPELALAIWLAKHEVLTPLEQATALWLDQAQSQLLERCLLDDLQPVQDEKAAIVLEAISGYVHARSQYPRLDLLTSLLSSFESAMERWQVKWKVKDEYDIQSILWLILRSAFDDLRYEEYLPKRGRSGHRYDIGIPQLSLVVEAKYTRKASDFQKIVDEIGKDSAQLPTQTTFTGIVVFVYDESCSVEQHAWAKQAIENTRLVKRCIIQSAPSTSRPKGKLHNREPGTRATKAKKGRNLKRARQK